MNAVAGANAKDKHFIGINHGKDFAVDEWIDARVINSDDVCPKCGEGIEIETAIEIGHTFKLGTKYSDPLNVCVLDENGKERQVIMGCLWHRCK